MKLEPGKFYRSKCGETWCCFKTTILGEPQARAHCIRISDTRTEYFYEDGRYDSAGEREHTLVEEVSADLAKR
jgi:hypothetical protein